MIERIIENVNNALYTYVLIIMLIACGVYFTVRTGFVQFRLLVIFIGAGLSADLLWGIADITMGAMAIINIPVIVILGKYAFRALKDYEKKVKAGEELNFKAAEIDLPHEVGCWK